MRLKFLGTKGEIEEEAPKHKYNSSLLIEEKGFKLLIDHGLISHPLSLIKPKAIIITHGHPDHFIWLKKDEEFQRKIYVTAETKQVTKYQKNFEIIEKNKWFLIGPFKILAFPVVHSLLSPAVGFKIKNSQTIIYNSDLIVPEDKSVLENIDLFVGDGSSFKSNLVRRKGNKLFGHTRMTTQINWCKNYKIKKIIFTHFGKEALEIGDEELRKKLKQEEIEIKIAYDGMRYKLS